MSRDLVVKRVFYVPRYQGILISSKNKARDIFPRYFYTASLSKCLMGYIIVVQGMTGYSQLDSLSKLTTCGSRDR